MVAALLRINTRSKAALGSGRVDRWCLIFGLAGDGKGRSGSWESSKASFKVMATGPTIMSAEPRSSTQHAGRHARRKFFEAIKLNPKDQRNPTRSNWAQEMDPPRKSGSRTPHRGDHLSNPELLAIKNRRSRLLGLSPAWIG